jgi:hypothetical protein
VLADWVLDRWRNGSVMETADQRLGDGYVREEVELVLNLCLLCSHPRTAKHVASSLDGGVVLREPQAGAYDFNVIKDQGLDLDAAMHAV